MLSARWLLHVFVSLSALAEVTVTRQPDRVAVNIDGQPATTFFYGAGVTKPYLYPLRTAAGTIMTRRWPMEERAGERHDHIHHRGLWFAHSDVNGIDFWNSDPSYHNPRMGRISVAEIDRISSGADHGVIQAQMEWRDSSGKELVHESRSMIFRSGAPRIVDIDITLTAREKITFHDEKDGVFGIRLAAELEEPAPDAPAEPVRSGLMTGANGCHHEAECWGKRGDWVDVSGKLDGEIAGVAILDHPQNPRFPTYWHARSYGLLAANIFGIKAFTKDPQADGSLTLEPGKTLRFRYRVILHSGNARDADIDRLHTAYTTESSPDGLR